MRTIEVDLDVFSEIWAQRVGGESCENDVLRRLLLSGGTYEQHSRHDSRSGEGALSRTEVEVKTSENSTDSEVEGNEVVGKIRWVDDIKASLGALGGSASLHAIYKEVKGRRRAGGRSVPKTLEAVIRRTIEDHSSDSANFRGEDLFALVGRGEWALR